MGACLAKAFGRPREDSTALLPDSVVASDSIVEDSDLSSRYSGKVSEFSLPQSIEAPRSQNDNTPTKPAAVPNFEAPSKNKPKSLGLGLKLGGGNADSDAGGGGMGLDFSALRSVNVETEESRRQHKLEKYNEALCELTPWLFMGSDAVARDEKKLLGAGITHVVNSAGSVCNNYLEATGKIKYCTLWLADGAQEDIESVFYDIIEFLDEGTDCGGTRAASPPHKTFVHCWQGVSRSATLCIMYIMWRNNWDYDRAYTFVREGRPVARPNAGFMCQLLAWEKRRKSGVASPRLYRISPHSDVTPNYLVARAVQSATRSSDLQSHTSCVVHAPAALYVWVGKSSSQESRAAAEKHADRLVRCEHAVRPVTVREGSEPEAFWQCFSDGRQGYDSRCTTPPANGVPTSARSKIPLNTNGTGTGPVLASTAVATAAAAAADDDDDESDDEGEEVADVDNVRMFEFPDWDEMAMFDSDDLMDDGIFVLVASRRSNPQSLFGYVWLGSEVEDVNDKKALTLAQQCYDTFGIKCDSVTVAHQDDEDAEFWKLFTNG